MGAAISDGTVVEYQLFRNGSLIATQSTLRFYENILTLGTAQTYGVLAVDDKGNVSNIAVISTTILDHELVISEAN